MNLRDITLLYLLTGVVFFAIDLLWLGVVAKGFYFRQLNGLLRDQVNWVAAGLFYLVYIVGIMVFALVPAVRAGTPWKAVLMGGLFGFFAYATFELTNLALIRGWPPKLVMVDILWGVVLTGSVAGISAWLAGRLM